MTVTELREALERIEGKGYGYLQAMICTDLGWSDAEPIIARSEVDFKHEQQGPGQVLVSLSGEDWLVDEVIDYCEEHR